jgi:hypothetical protein
VAKPEVARAGEAHSGASSFVACHAAMAQPVSIHRVEPLGTPSRQRSRFTLDSSTTPPFSATSSAATKTQASGFRVPGEYYGDINEIISAFRKQFRRRAQTALPAHILKVLRDFLSDCQLREPVTPVTMFRLKSPHRSGAGAGFLLRRGLREITVRPVQRRTRLTVATRFPGGR